VHTFSLGELMATGKKAEKAMALLLRFGGFPEPLLAQSDRDLRRWQRERMSQVLRDDLRDTDKREVDFVVLQDRKPRFAVECKTGEKAFSPALRYFAERTDIPKFFQVHLGKSHFQQGNLAMLPYVRFCQDLGLP
jgi:hypothetical protein